MLTQTVETSPTSKARVLANLISDGKLSGSVSHTSLSLILGVPYPSKQYWYVIRYARSILKEKGYFLELVDVHLGYRIVKDDRRRDKASRMQALHAMCH